MHFTIKAIKWIFLENNTFSVITEFSAEEGSAAAQITGVEVTSLGANPSSPTACVLMVLTYGGICHSLGFSGWWLSYIIIQDNGGAARSLHTNQKVEIEVWAGDYLEWDFRPPFTSLGLIFLILEWRGGTKPSQSPSCYRSWWNNSSMTLIFR